MPASPIAKRTRGVHLRRAVLTAPSTTPKLPPASSTTPAPIVTEPQSSRAFVKNMCRHVFSEICYSRRLFSNESFEEIEVYGVHIHALGRMEDADKKHVSEQAKQFMTMLEGGVFEALYKGYLKKCVLIVSRDDEGEDVLEAWAVSVGWRDDSHGNSQPSFGIECTSQVSASPLHGGSQISKEDVDESSSATLRRLAVLLQTMPELPTDCWVSMRLFYRDEVTPAAYEPGGFEAAPPETHSTLVFKEPPMGVRCGPGSETDRHTVGLQVFTPAQGEYKALAGSSVACKEQLSEAHTMSLLLDSAAAEDGLAERMLAFAEALRLAASQSAYERKSANQRAKVKDYKDNYDRHRECGYCRNVLGFHLFYKCSSATCGLSRYCKACEKKKRKERYDGSGLSYFTRMLGSAREHSLIRKGPAGQPPVWKNVGAFLAFAVRQLVKQRYRCAISRTLFEHPRTLSLERVDESETYHDANCTFIRRWFQSWGNGGQQWTRQKFDAVPHLRKVDAQYQQKIDNRAELRTVYTHWSRNVRDPMAARNIKRKRKKRGQDELEEPEIDWDTFIEIYTRQSGRCFYLDIPLCVGESTCDWKLSFERLNGNKWYTRDNVVLVCQEVNFHVRTTAGDEHEKWCREVAERFWPY